MAKDAGDIIGSVVGTIAREIGESVSHNGNGHSPLDKGKGGSLSGARGVAAGAALAAAVPMAGMAAKKVVLKRVGGQPASKAKDAGGGLLQKITGGARNRVGSVAEGAKESVGKGVKDAVGEKVEQVGGAPEVAKEAGKRMIPGLGGKGDSKGKKGTPGVGKGRRMPVQQEVDVGVPLSVAYNQWTQFEEWPQFMHRLDQATQEDDCTISFRTKLWGMSKEFVGQIVEQRPDERIQWSVKEGVAHSGVVIFHELGPRLTRVQVSLDVEPGSLLEKAARGMRHVKRAVRADLHRFKAFIEVQEVETGAWRGEIHDGEVAKQHDRQRDYAEFDDIHDKESSHKPQKEGGSSSRSSSSQSSSGRSRQKKRSKQSSSRKRDASHRSRSSSTKSASSTKSSSSRKGS